MQRRDDSGAKREHKELGKLVRGDHPSRGETRFTGAAGFGVRGRNLTDQRRDQTGGPGDNSKH